MTRIATIECAADFNAAVKLASALLRQGEVVALPTETVYGLAANALDPEAVRRIFTVKGRPSHNPVIVHVCSLEMAKNCVAEWPETADALAREFWPGPLTLVLPKSPAIPDIVSAGGGTVGVRWPAHSFMQEVIRECGFPLAAPSANPSNQVSPTNAAHVHKSLRGKIPLIVDGGQSQVGIESTVVDLTSGQPKVLRPGMIGEKALRAATEGLAAFGNSPARSATLRSPGLLPLHYSPKARLAVLNWRDEPELRARIAAMGGDSARAHIIAYEQIPLGGGFARVSVIPFDAEAFARALYGELHAGDEAGAELIVIERPPAAPEWEGILDRITRASAPR